MKMKPSCLAALLVAACFPAVLPAQMTARLRPDLTVREYQFAPTNDKWLRVNVANVGPGAAGASKLRLTVRRINGAAVGRTMEVDVPAVAGNQNDWVSFDAGQILPKDVALKDTTFRLNLDVTEAVAESNEKNNETWHNLN